MYNNTSMWQLHFTHNNFVFSLNSPVPSWVLIPISSYTIILQIFRFAISAQNWKDFSGALFKKLATLLKVMVDLPFIGRIYVHCVVFFSSLGQKSSFFIAPETLHSIITSYCKLYSPTTMWPISIEVKIFLRTFRSLNFWPTDLTLHCWRVRIGWWWGQSLSVARR